MQLYPLKFQPIFKYRIWGGNKLKAVLNKKVDDKHIGESWEISGVAGDESIVSEGELQGYTLQDLIREFKADFIGRKPYLNFGEEFPLLIKFIDAEHPLSIQVHPNDIVAKERHNSFGKNEMWYIMDADENGELILGFKEQCSKKKFENKIIKNEVIDVLNAVKVTEGDVFNIPAGRIHAIGSGVLLAEIQQSSDITYRVFDYNRIDKATGEKRDLHINQSLDVIDYSSQENYKTSYDTVKNTSNKLIHSTHFTTNFIFLEGKLEKDYSDIDSFIILICIKGSAEIYYNEKAYEIQQGETLLLPASLNSIILTGEFSKLIEVYI